MHNATAPAIIPLHDQAFDFWAARHLLNRAGFGGTPREVQQLQKLGVDGAVDRLLDFEGTPDDLPRPEFDSGVMQPRSDEQRREYRRAQREGNEELLTKFRMERQARQRKDRQQIRRMRLWWMSRFLTTTRPLEERMTLFWHGHFATGYRSVEHSWNQYVQNELFRSFALGNFRDLTRRIIRDPAMLKYLNNNRNNRRQPNENLARELMELFTLGEGNAYSERDIKEGARALTGYTFDAKGFTFNQRMHDDGSKTILGRTGNWDGDDFVDIILSQPQVAEFITLKLYKFFVHDIPDEMTPEQTRFLRAASKRFRSSGYEIKSLLRTFFTSEHFYADANRGTRIKGPVELITGVTRSLGTPARDERALTDAARLMGQDLMEPPSVKGWPGGRTWINTSTFYVRQNVAVYQLTGQRPNGYEWRRDRTTFEATDLIADLDETARANPETIADYLLAFVLAVPAAAERRTALVNWFRSHEGRMDNEILTGALALIAAMPEFQVC